MLYKIKYITGLFILNIQVGTDNINQNLTNV